MPMPIRRATAHARSPRVRRYGWVRRRGRIRSKRRIEPQQPRRPIGHRVQRCAHQAGKRQTLFDEPTSHLGGADCRPPPRSETRSALRSSA